MGEISEANYRIKIACSESAVLAATALEGTAVQVFCGRSHVAKVCGAVASAAAQILRGNLHPRPAAAA